MRVLIFHGYLLRGTGSNVYNASLAQALARLGHEVHLLCQDRDAAELEWVDRFGRGRTASSGRGRGRRARRRVAGSVTAYVPDIGGLLPVYVADRYEGFEVKTFPDLSDAELDRYLSANVGAVRDVVGAAGGARRRARQPPGDGAGDPRPRRPRFRDQDPRLGARVHGEAEPRALPALRARGARRRRRRPGRARATRPRACGRRSATRRCRSARGSARPGVDTDLFAAGRRRRGRAPPA